MTLLESIKKVREVKKRNFNQTFDLIINLKEIDLKKTENKIDENFILPKGTGKEVSITLFSEAAKKIEGCKIVKDFEIENLVKNKKTIKKLINETNFFLSEPKLMPVVGKYLGKFLAPRRMMPKPVTGNVNEIIEGMKKSIKIVMDKQPIIHTIVGSEKMDDKDVEENIKSLLSYLEKKLPRGKHNIKNVYLKTTMGHPVKLEVG
jgi:large subunit ribosomal protein L1